MEEDDMYDLLDLFVGYDEEYSDPDSENKLGQYLKNEQAALTLNELADDEIFSDEDFYPRYQWPKTFPPIPVEDAGGREIPHSTTLSTAEGLDQAVWAALPDALVDRVLTRLPPAVFARFRSVCKRWNELPSSPGWLCQYAEVARRPSCTIMHQRATGGDVIDLPFRIPSFFCHSEQKWFGMPPVGPCQGAKLLNWELGDADCGLVCYVGHEESGLWLCVSNPLTRATTVLPPPYPGITSWEDCPSYDFVKFVVDPQSKTYKIVVLAYWTQSPATLLYDSTTTFWTELQNPPRDDLSGNRIRWKRTIFTPYAQPRVVQAFDVDTGTWREVEMGYAPGRRFRYDFVSGFDKFMIIRSYNDPKKRTRPTSVLVLKDDAASPFPLFRGNVWVEMDVHNRGYLQKVVEVTSHATSHSDCLIFTNSSKNEWVTYTFSTRTWRKMPIASEKDPQYSWRYEWYDWEPRWDIGTGLEPSPILNTLVRKS